MAATTKRVTRLPDGRELIYFDDADTALSPERGIDIRAPRSRRCARTAERRMGLDRGRAAGPGVSAARRARPADPDHTFAEARLAGPDVYTVTPRVRLPVTSRS
jgi:hypothetical protein